MAIDIRATVTCSLGTLISASLSDDYVQGTGLIKTKGSCEINGTITPAIGTVVTFSYTKGGVTRTIPRRVRVLSSFADPFRRTTKVELGCKLTYLQDLRDPDFKWLWQDDPKNEAFTTADEAIITVPIYAASVAAECASRLGVLGSVFSLSNRFSIAEFDFSAGYVSVLSDLLVSEGYCGYLDYNETLKVFSLDADGGVSKVLTSEQIIDVSSIGVGPLPAEAVFVTYDSLKLKSSKSEEELSVTAPLVAYVWAQDPLSETPSDRVKEGGNIRFDITLSAKPKAPAVYTYTLFGSATSGQDYQPSISWSNGVTETEEGVIEVPIDVDAFSALISTAEDQVPNEIETIVLLVGGVAGTAYLVDPDAEEDEPLSLEQASQWENVKSSRRYSLPISYSTQDGSETLVFNMLATSEVKTQYSKIKLASGESASVVTERISVEQTGSIAVMGAMVTEYLSNGMTYNQDTVRRTVREKFSYDSTGNETLCERKVTGSFAYLAGALGVPFVVNGVAVSVNTTKNVTLEEERRESITVGERQQVSIYSYKPWPLTVSGQQTIASGRDAYTSASQVQAYLESISSTNMLVLTDVSVVTQRRTEPQQAPSQIALINALNVDQTAAASPVPESQKKKEVEAPNPNNDWRTESVSESEYAFGSPTASRRIELRMPYAPDDTFYKAGIPPNVTYLSVASDADIKARSYGRTQNKLLLGNRSGMNVQVAPESLPDAPFSPVVVQANGLSALYRTNGTSYTMDANGIVASSDLLFWGAVGGTGTFWFPVAPGITTLPETPPVVDGQMTVTSVVPTANETVIANARTRSTLVVTSFSYALELLTEAAVTTRTTLYAGRVLPVTQIALAATAPTVVGGASVAVPAVQVAIAASAPSVLTGASVPVPTTVISVVGVEPDMVGRPRTEVKVPVTAIGVAGGVPAVAGGASVALPSADVALAGVAPEIAILETDPYFSSVSLLLHMDGSDGSTSFTDSSSNALTVTTYGNAQVDTAITMFGTGALLLDGNGDYLEVPDNSDWDFRTGDYTVEAWIYLPSTAVGTSPIVGRGVPLSGRAWGLRFLGSSLGIMRLQWLLGSGVSRTVNWSPSANTWYYVAACRSGTTLRFFVDGIQVGSDQTDSADYTSQSYTVRVGYDGTNYFTGSIDDVRVTTGVGRYTSNFTPPTAPFPDA